MVGSDHSSIEGMMKSDHLRPSNPSSSFSASWGSSSGGRRLNSGSQALRQGQWALSVGGVVLQWGPDVLRVLHLGIGQLDGDGQGAAAAGQWEAEQLCMCVGAGGRKVEL